MKTYDLLTDLFNTMDSMLETPSNFSKQTPSYDVVEKDAEFQLNILAPGVSKESIVLKTEGRLLNIVATSAYSVDEKDGSVTKGITDLSFEVTFKLPSSIDTTNISATIFDGILSIKLAKSKDFTNFIKVN